MSRKIANAWEENEPASLGLAHSKFNSVACMLNRTFEASAPNRKWIADFTYVWTTEGWLYVAAVIDLFSRRVVGWSMSAAMTAQLVTDALVMAIWRRGKPDALLHHSDRGSQYTSEQFQSLMADHGVVCRIPATTLPREAKTGEPPHEVGRRSRRSACPLAISLRDNRASLDPPLLLTKDLEFNGVVT
jgi:transposase InsO family protein